MNESCKPWYPKKAKAAPMKTEDLPHVIELLNAVLTKKPLQMLDDESEGDGPGWTDIAINADGVSIDIARNPRNFRVKPEPKYLTWTLATTPIGAVVRNMNPNAGRRVPAIITGADLASVDIDAETKVYIVSGGCGQESFPAATLLASFEWCWPHEQADPSKWKRCGIEVIQ